MDSKIKNILFISVIRPMFKTVTSTYIMTHSLLQGLKENGYDITFIAICEYPDEMKLVEKEYRKLVDRVITVPSKFCPNLGKYRQLSLMVKYCFLTGFYNKTIENISFTKKPDLIISHSPSLEGIFYGKAVKKYFSDVPYFQYWSDPIALSGIIPEKFSVKRYPFWLIERVALQSADRVIYGTKTLMQFQKLMYPKVTSKMFYIDIPYLNKEERVGKKYKNSILYAGNYYKNLRNLQPLIDAVESMSGFKLDIYGNGDIDSRNYKNTTIHDRVSADELEKIEVKYEYLVCILKHSCIQIPGKIFYDMARNVKIIVIADGKYRYQLCDYLRSYKRFIVCENNTMAIKQALEDSDFAVNRDYIVKNYSPQKICSMLLLGGLK